MSHLSLLVVTAAPDLRDSTRTLTAVVGELRRRPGVTAELWYLRHGPGPSSPLDRTVDDLRSLAPAATLEKIGLGRPAGVLRGRQLRRWLRDLAPDIVILDDGLGGRVLNGAAAHRTVVRLNSEPPDDGPLEGSPVGEADLFLVPPDGPTAPAGTASLAMPPLLWDHADALPFLGEDARAGVRRRLGLPVDQPMVVGWGADPWLDGPDLLVRTLWTLEHRHDVRAHGLWLGLDDDGTDARRLREEAVRCGLADRFFLRPNPSLDARLCGDAVFLPYRSEGSTAEVREALVSGVEVVTFPVWDLADPGLRTVPNLDTHAAAAAIARALGTDRDANAAAAAERYDVRPWVDRFLTAIAELP